MTAFDHTAGRLSELDAEVVRHVPPGGNWRDLPPDFASQRVEQIRRTAAAGEGSRSTYYGRLAWDRPSYTVSTYFNRPGNGCFIHPEAARLITVREAARLQGFPDAARFKGRGRARYLQVGNAVPPLLAYQIALGFPRGPVVDLFAGAGGLSAGFSWAGHDVVLAIDSDASCIEALQAGDHARETLQLDLGTAQASRTVVSAARAALGDQDLRILVGGPPCQGFSTAGKNLARDSRNELVFAFLDAVAALAPEVVLMENVPALMWRRGRPILASIVRRLSDLGYQVDQAILHAEGYGVPQLRRRLFVQARRDSSVTWPIPHRRIMGPTQSTEQPGWIGNELRPEPSTVGDAIADLPVTTATDPDKPVRYHGKPSSGYQQWVRGETDIREFLPKLEFTSSREQLELNTAA